MTLPVQTYEQIPKELRALLDQVYTPEGVVIWWTSPHDHFVGWSARDMWHGGRRDVVLAEAESLLGQVAT